MRLFRVTCVLLAAATSVAVAGPDAARERAGETSAVAPGANAVSAQERRRDAVEFVRRYYRRVSRRRFASAWAMLASQVRRTFGSFEGWRAGHRRSLGATVLLARARPSRSGALMVVSIGLSTRDRDACNGRIVRQAFRGRWVLAPRAGSLIAVRLHIRKTGGGSVRISESDCPPPPPPPTPPPTRLPSNCQGYDPCLPPGPDVDCAGGSGDGPRYVNGPVTVTGSDPYDLDRDGDGTGCDT